MHRDNDRLVRPHDAHSGVLPVRFIHSSFSTRGYHAMGTILRAQLHRRPRRHQSPPSDYFHISQPPCMRGIMGPHQLPGTRILCALPDLRDRHNRSLLVSQSDPVLRLLGDSLDTHVLLHRRLGRPQTKICRTKIPIIHVFCQRRDAFRFPGSLRLHSHVRLHIRRRLADSNVSSKPDAYVHSVVRISNHIHRIRGETAHRPVPYVASGRTRRGPRPRQRSTGRPSPENGWLRIHQVQPAPLL